MLTTTTTYSKAKPVRFGKLLLLGRTYHLWIRVWKINMIHSTMAIKAVLQNINMICFTQVTNTVRIEASSMPSNGLKASQVIFSWGGSSNRRTNKQIILVKATIDHTSQLAENGIFYHDSVGNWHNYLHLPTLAHVRERRISSPEQTNCMCCTLSLWAMSHGFHASLSTYIIEWYVVGSITTQ